MYFRVSLSSFLFPLANITFTNKFLFQIINMVYSRIDVLIFAMVSH